MDERYCPICGVKKGDDESLVAAPEVNQHRCRAKVLPGIDSTRTFDEPRERTMTFQERLKAGFGVTKWR